jgi:hypothetical protein
MRKITISKIYLQWLIYFKIFRTGHSDGKGLSYAGVIINTNNLLLDIDFNKGFKCEMLLIRDMRMERSTDNFCNALI